jgi:hypothetical protein
MFLGCAPHSFMPESAPPGRPFGACFGALGAAGGGDPLRLPATLEPLVPFAAPGPGRG